MHIVHLQNTGKNGRIVIGNGGKEIFSLCLLHYNDTCKVNQQFTGGECKVIKLCILLHSYFEVTAIPCIYSISAIYITFYLSALSPKAQHKPNNILKIAFCLFYFLLSSMYIILVILVTGGFFDTV